MHRNYFKWRQQQQTRHTPPPLKNRCLQMNQITPGRCVQDAARSTGILPTRPEHGKETIENEALS